MKISVQAYDLRSVMLGVGKTLEKATTRAMDDAGRVMKQEVREQTRDAGLGTRLANTWRGTRYPQSGVSMGAAYDLRSAAPDIISSYVSGATIRPTGGRNYLWIPTRSVPRAAGSGRATSTKRMSPEAVEAYFNADFILKKGRGGNMLAFIAKDRGTTRGGRLRKVRKGRLGQGAAQELVLMFTLVRTTRKPKVFDLDAVGRAGAAEFKRAVFEHLPTM